jgi:hypothetical protein
MAQIGLNITVTSLTGFLIIRWVKPSSPLAEVGRSDAFTFPYDDVYTIPDLAPVVYTVQMWRSDDGIALDQLIKDWSIDASKQSELSVRGYQYLTGRGETEGTPGDGSYWADPTDTDVNLVDERLDGFTKDQLQVHEAGFGNKLDAEYDLLAGGGITLLGGKTFDEGVAWFITVFEATETTIPADAGGSQRYAGVEVIAEDVEFDEVLRNKLIIADFAATVGTITFPDLTLIPTGTHATFNTHRGSQNYLKLQFDAGDTVRFNNEDVNIIYLARCESLSIYFDDGVCYVTEYSGNAIRRGMVAPDYDATRDADRGNFIYADESIGELDREDYPALYEFIDQLSGDAVCPLGTGVGQWSYDSGGGVYPNKRKYGIDTVAETFRVPHLSGVTAKMSSTPGVYEADVVGPVDFEIRSGLGGDKTNVLNNGGGIVINCGLSGMDSFGTWFNNTVSGSPVIIRSTNAETRVKSYSQKPFIYL